MISRSESRPRPPVYVRGGFQTDPVGATGVRMLLDAQKHVAGNAGEMQAPNAKRVATLNIGGRGDA